MKFAVNRNYFDVLNYSLPIPNNGEEKFGKYVTTSQISRMIFLVDTI